MYIDTQRVKNTIIVMFTVLNAVLFALIISRGSAYAFTAERETELTRLADKYGITISASFPGSFKPMATMEVAPYEFDIYAEARRFFGTDEGLTLDESWNWRALSNESGSLLLEDGFLMREMTTPFSTAEYLKKGKGDAAAQKKLCDEYLKCVSPPGMDFREYRRDAATGGAVVIDYRGWYRGQWFYSNYIKLTVTNAGITVARCFYSGVPLASSGFLQEVFAPDEALFALFKQLVTVFSGEAVDISGCAVVYNLDEPAIERAKAEPYYQFEIRVRDASRAYLVNCYTNTVK